MILDLVGADEAPGVKAGGVLEQVTRELSIEALPGDIPDTIEFDASGLEIGATLTVAELTAPPGVTLLDDPETVVASITAPRACSSRTRTRSSRRPRWSARGSPPRPRRGRWPRGRRRTADETADTSSE